MPSLQLESQETKLRTMTQAILKTRLGDMTLELFSDVAPKHAENFIQLAKAGFYDGTLFHRVIPGFMIQGGDPLSRGEDKRLHGTGGAEHNLKAEFSDLPHVRGVVSMARAASPDSASSQFFIVVDDAPHLDGQYSLFGRIVKGMEVADAIVELKSDHRDNPLEPVSITVEIVEG
jgi:peptidyl-prolyl cis-trans isomerase B (cyclophilin B)